MAWRPSQECPALPFRGKNFIGFELLFEVTSQLPWWLHDRPGQCLSFLCNLNTSGLSRLLCMPSRQEIQGLTFRINASENPVHTDISIGRNACLLIFLLFGVLSISSKTTWTCHQIVVLHWIVLVRLVMKYQDRFCAFPIPIVIFLCCLSSLECNFAVLWICVLHSFSSHLCSFFLFFFLLLKGAWTGLEYEFAALCLYNGLAETALHGERTLFSAFFLCL